MAILNGLIQKMKGSAGQLTFKSLNGQTVVSEKPTKVSNPRTDMQQRQRTRWTNIIRMYKGLVPLLRNAFENKLATQSDNNSILPNYTTEDAYTNAANSYGGVNNVFLRPNLTQK